MHQLIPLFILWMLAGGGGKSTPTWPSPKSPPPRSPPPAKPRAAIAPTAKHTSHAPAPATAVHAKKPAHK